MVRKSALFRQLTLLWVGILVGIGALGLLELLLLQAHRALALGITGGIGVITGAIASWRFVVKSHRPLITVRDLRHH
jgi:hypothetical protein